MVWIWSRSIIWISRNGAMETVGRMKKSRRSHDEYHGALETVVRSGYFSVHDLDETGSKAMCFARGAAGLRSRARVAHVWDVVRRIDLMG
jgi:hypothetical protein